MALHHVPFVPEDDTGSRRCSSGLQKLVREKNNGLAWVRHARYVLTGSEVWKKPFARPTRNGITYAVDFHGNVLGAIDYFASPQEIMYADVPIKGIATPYAIIGDAFGWLCVVGFMVFIVLARRGPLGRE